MPASPRATASTDVIASCVLVGSRRRASRATGSSQFVSGCQKSANWIQPPTTASTARTPTGTSIVSGAFVPWCAWRCSLHERARLAAEDDEVHAERVEAGEERADRAPTTQQDRRRTSASCSAAAMIGVLREEARERRHADERERADEERPLRPRHELADAAHLADVLLAARARG